MVSDTIFPTAADGTFRALRIDRANGAVTASLTALTLDDLTPGEVVVRVAYSSINYKDALAATGAGAILRRFPLVGGIDLAGRVVESSDSRFAPGDPVLACGCGLGETHDGGFAELARVPAKCIERIPDGLDPRTAMIIGTAGFTAALALERIERNGQTPAQGPLLVTGATGGVGSFAVALASRRGYEVHALTGKASARDYLESLGARELFDRHALAGAGKPLEPARWGGGIDTVGGPILARLLASTRPNGNVAAIGLAADSKLETTVMPFILRGVSLIGVNSVHVDPELRASLWRRLAAEWDPAALERIVANEISLDELPGAFKPLLDGKVIGRTLVKVGA